MLDQHDDHELGISRRREAREPRVRAVVVPGLPGVFVVARRAPGDLRRARLAGDRHAALDVRCVRRSRAVVDDPVEPVDDVGEVLARHVHATPHARLKLLDQRAVRPADALDQLRDVERAAVGDRRVRHRELHQRDLGVALPDGLVEREPAAEAVRVVLLVPVDRRDEAARLGVDADAGALTEPELARHVREPVHTDLPREVVEERVARAHDRLVHVDVAVLLQAAEPTPAVLVVARAVDVAVRVEDAAAERRERADHLERRAREVRLVDRLVDQRAQRIVDDLARAIMREAPRQLVEVVARLREERAHAPRAHVDDDGAARWMPAERALRDAHQLHVERERQISARHRLAARLVRPLGVLLVRALPARLDDHAPHAAPPAHIALPGALDAAAADGVARAIALIRRALEVLGVDLVEVADGVRRERAERIHAHRLSDDVDALQLRLVLLERRELIARDVAEHLDLVRAPVQGDRLEPRDEVRLLPRVEAHQLGQARHILDGIEQLRREVDVVRGAVRRDDAPGRVAEQPARRRQRDRLGDVLGGDLLPALVVEQLHVRRAQEQPRERDDRRERHPLVVLLELADLAPRRQQVHGALGPSPAPGAVVRVARRSAS